MTATTKPATSMPRASRSVTPEPELAPDHGTDASHVVLVGGDTLPADQRSSVDQSRCVGGNKLGDDQPKSADHCPFVVANSSPEAIQPARSKRVSSPASSSPQTTVRTSPISVAPAGLSSEFALLTAAANLDDIEKARLAVNNRVKAMERDGLTATPMYETQAGILAGLIAIEHEAIKALQRALRKHPLGPWVKNTVGIGEKQGARLIAAIGDVYWNHLEDRPRRGPAELWAYCGYAPGQKRRKGVKSNWNADAKMRAFLIAESCIKQTGGTDDAGNTTNPGNGSRRRSRSPYRDIYDYARTNWADRDVSDGHKHNHALRLVAKAVLKDLFLAAKEGAT